MSKEIDWDEVRIQAAIAALPKAMGMVADAALRGCRLTETTCPRQAAVTAIEYADALVMLMYGIGDIKMRMFNIGELKRIMGFPDNYILVGTQAEQKKYIGNAVEVTIARKLCEALCGELCKRRIKVTA